MFNHLINMKTWKILSNDSEYMDAMNKVIDNPALPGTCEYEEREFLLVLIRDYQDRNMIVGDRNAGILN